MEENDLSNYFRNSPPEPGSKQPVKGVSEETEEMYLVHEVIEFPSPPSIRKYSPYRTEEIKVGQAGLHIANSLRESFESGQDYRTDLSHWIGCLKAMSLDLPTTKELERLGQELDKTHNIEKHKKTLEDVRALLLDLRPGRKG